MNRLLLNILLALAWMFLNGDLYFANFIEGFVISFIILWISSHATKSINYIKKIPKLISFIFYFLYELIVANLEVAYDIVTPRHMMKPSIIAVPTDAETEMEITLLANLITLTPGTLSLDVSTDKKIIYVHSMYTTNAQEFIEQLKSGLERKLLEVMR